MIDPITARWVIWGYKNTYHTHNHIHEALFRALKFMGRDVVWVDTGDPLMEFGDFRGCIFLTEHQKMLTLPRHKESFYFVHNIEDSEVEFFTGLPTINWGGKVRINTLPEFRCTENIAPPQMTCGDLIWDYALDWRGLPLFRNLWATDLLPHEIEEIAKGFPHPWNPQSKVINWIGTVNNDHNLEVPKFIQACKENGIGFRGIGGFTPGQGKNHPTIQENAALIRASYMAPAIGNTRQAAVGYVPCRVFKNISYGMYPPTNLEAANELFDYRLICNRDPYELFYEARADLPQTPQRLLQNLMRTVAQEHTYVNRVNEISNAIRIYQEAR